MREDVIEFRDMTLVVAERVEKLVREGDALYGIDGLLESMDRLCEIDRDLGDLPRHATFEISLTYFRARAGGAGSPTTEGPGRETRKPEEVHDSSFSALRSHRTVIAADVAAHRRAWRRSGDDERAT
jgi:hypothetical protein